MEPKGSLGQEPSKASFPQGLSQALFDLQRDWRQPGGWGGAGNLWPWPHLTSVGQGESFHPIENWTELVLGLEQLSCECRVVVGVEEEGRHGIPCGNNNIAFV